MADNWYSEKDLPDPPAPLKLNAWNDLQFTRWVPTWDGDVLLELYVYLRVKIKANYPHGQIQVQVMRENTEPPDAAAPNDLTVGRRNQTLAQMSSTSPEFGRPIKQLWYGACTPNTPLTWQLFIGPEFAAAARSTLYAKAIRQARQWTLS